MNLLDRINKAGYILQKIELTEDPYLKMMYRSEYEIERKNIQFIKYFNKKKWMFGG